MELTSEVEDEERMESMMSSKERLWFMDVLALSNAECIEFQTIADNCFGKVAKVICGKSTYYFKTDPLLMGEAVKAQYLCANYPKIFHEVIAVHAHESWQLSRDCGKELLYAIDLNYWFDSVRQLAKFHRKSFDKTALAPKKFTRAPFAFDQFSSLMADSQFIEYWQVNSQKRLKIEEGCSRLSSAVAHVSNALPKSALCHGDSHARNALIDSEGSCKWFDVREAHIGNPLFDIGWFLWWLVPDRTPLGIGIEVTKELREKLYREYLQELGVVENEPSIMDLMVATLMFRVVYFHRRYYQKTSIRPYVPYYLKQLIKLLESQY